MGEASGNMDWGHASMPPSKLTGHVRESVVFVDWYGVLSKEPFWAHIISNGLNPYHALTKALAVRLFEKEPEMVRAWMRGDYDTRAILEHYLPGAGHRRLRRVLTASLHKDFEKMRPSFKLVRALQHARASSFVVIATDNMECFADYWRKVPTLASAVDEVLCSSAVRSLKSDSSEAFFGPWLRKHGLNFANALLLDDSRRNCELFRNSGGLALEVSDDDAACEVLRLWLQGSLEGLVARMSIRGD